MIKKTLIALCITVCVAIGWSMVLETMAIRNERQDVETALKVASRAATKVFNSFHFSSSEDDLSGATLFYDINNSQNRSTYLEYLSVLETQGKTMGIWENSELTKKVTQLHNSLNEYNSGSSTSIYTPQQAFLTFLDEKYVESEFRKASSNIIGFNYNAETTGLGGAFTGADRVRVVSAKATQIGQPTLINFGKASNMSSQEYLAFVSLFGTSNYDASSMPTSMTQGNEYLFTIAYDYEFEIQWEHHTISPFFHVKPSYFWNKMVADNGRPIIDERGQIVIQMPSIKIKQRYILTN